MPAKRRNQVDSPLHVNLDIDDITQPIYDSVIQDLLTIGDPAGLLSSIPGLGPIIGAAVKPIQEGVKTVLTDREKARLRGHLETSASIVSAIQQANRNTYRYILNAIKYPALRTLILVQQTQEAKSFWKEAETRLNQSKKVTLQTISVLQRVGLVTATYGFEHADGELRDYPDLNVSMDYTDGRHAEMKRYVENHLDKVYDEILKLAVSKDVLDRHQRECPTERATKPFLINVRRSHDTLIGVPQTTLAGYYFLQLFQIVAKAQKSKVQSASKPTPKKRS
ncbi:hypothetical protein [Bradyrhizobium sp. 143]|uniref:hypothetical protein n=1 Tax=Bradyrhizobium sp. 143 TaxID=2782619 RepID=UPI001FF8E0B5|nr:hypothetical protein [Bradyrhizobium sp. 143]MCK1713118.1 hypothetical protein [Bradyrhizobium sp. 143]